MPKIRTVFQPDVEIEVDDAEHESLLAQGLVHDPAQEPPAPAKGATTVTAETAKE